MPTDFEDALKSLESGFISISGQMVSFVNPSVRDFLKAYLIDREFLFFLPLAAKRADWVQQLWQHAEDVFKSDPDTLKSFANTFSTYAEKIDSTPTMKRKKNNGGLSFSIDDLSLSGRGTVAFSMVEDVRERGLSKNVH